ncbi:MerR family transcriptional regulator [Streptomyces sp. NPDC051909]|uniref:MerR family transcriptional regulator n=1 Tax=Streptomyces sp. NPDC051909 TaxID=3154944 RepID=UPI0034262330
MDAMLTIGDFARATGLTPKALRRYDELGLLRPARVDPFSGYRYYAGEQAERARLVGWLRRIGMPLAEIGRVCALYETDAAGAARAIRAYWARVEHETATRRDLAASLVDRMKGTTGMNSMNDRNPRTPDLTFRAALLLDPGLTRPSQQDAAHAGARLLAVADGYGPEGGAAATGAVAALGAVPTPTRAGDLLNALEAGLREANEAVARCAESGTTLTAALLAGNRLALAHVGDSRAYLLRDGALRRLTRDHTVVQELVDAGELSPAEAAARPDRALLLKALDGGDVPPEPELALHELRAGDRLLLCTDGLSAVVPAEEIAPALTRGADPAATARELIGRARDRGAPDNVACVLADVVDQ